MSRQQIEDGDVVSLDDLWMTEVFLTDQATERLESLEPEIEERIKIFFEF